MNGAMWLRGKHVKTITWFGYIYALPWIMNGKLDNRKKLLLPFKDFYSWRCMYAHAYTNAHKRTHTHKHTRTGTCTHTNLDTTFTLPGSCGSYDTQGREKENWTGMLETIQAFFHSLCLLKGNMYICLLWLCPITSRRALRSAMFSHNQQNPFIPTHHLHCYCQTFQKPPPTAQDMST